MERVNLISYLTGIRLIVGKEMASYCHTLPLLMSKSGSSLKAGKKLPRVWLEYVFSVAKMFLDEPSGRGELLYPSFGNPLVFLLPPYDSSKMVRNRFEGQRSRQHLFKCLRSGLHSLTNPCPLADELMFLF